MVTRELDNIKDYIDTDINTAYDHTTQDLCQDCVKKLWEIIGEFCSAQKSQNF